MAFVRYSLRGAFVSTFQWVSTCPLAPVRGSEAVPVASVDRRGLEVNLLQGGQLVDTLAQRLRLRRRDTHR